MQGRAPVAARPRPIVVVCDDGLETSSIVDILEDLNDGFSRQPVSNRILPRPALAVFSSRTGTSEPVAPIGFDLSE
jgi:hypothetical protein